MSWRRCRFQICNIRCFIENSNKAKLRIHLKISIPASANDGSLARTLRKVINFLIAKTTSGSKSSPCELNSRVRHGHRFVVRGPMVSTTAALSAHALAVPTCAAGVPYLAAAKGVALISLAFSANNDMQARYRLDNFYRPPNAIINGFPATNE